MTVAPHPFVHAVGAVALAIAACGGGEELAASDAVPRHDAGPADAMPSFEDGYHVTFETTPSHVHRNDVVTVAR